MLIKYHLKSLLVKFVEKLVMLHPNVSSYGIWDILTGKFTGNILAIGRNVVADSISLEDVHA